MRKITANINTSILIAAAWTHDAHHNEALNFLKTCMKKKVTLVTGNITLYELKKKRSEKAAIAIMKKYGIHVVKLNLHRMIKIAEEKRMKMKLSYKRVMDIVHVLTAKKTNVEHLVTYDRKLRSLARKLGIKGWYPREFPEKVVKNGRYG